MVIRFCNPSRFDPSPQGTIVKVQKDENYVYYIQASEYTDMPNWMKWGDFLEGILKEKINDPEFVKSCIKIFNDKLLSINGRNPWEIWIKFLQ